MHPFVVVTYMLVVAPLLPLQNYKPIGPTTAATFTAAIANWAASGGGDWPEAQLYALSQVGNISSRACSRQPAWQA